jgi:peptide/nickel transport system ATP-binding protein
VLRLVPPPARIVGGSLHFQGHDLLALNDAAMRGLRGKSIAMIFQNPAFSLNPILSIGAQLIEILRWHERISRTTARDRAAELLRLVGIADPLHRLRQFPHELSGGMKQRICIARALLCNPALILADEPTTNLDVTIQAQILDLMRDLKQRLGSAIMLITHDLGVVAEMAERVVVMYAGRKVEEATVGEIFARPLHPYTRGLLGAVPKLGSSLHEGGRSRLAEIPGLVPSLRRPIIGCAFAGRCPMVTDLCRQVAPAIEMKISGHLVACHHVEHRLAA